MRRLNRHRAAVMAYGAICALLAGAAATLLLAHLVSGRGHFPPEWQFTLPLGLLASAFGWLLLRRRPRQKLGWVVAALGLSLLIQTTVTAYADYTVYVATLPATSAIYVAARVPGLALVPILATLFLLFPTGSLPGPRWRWIGALIAASALLTLPGELGAAPRDTDFAQIPNPLEMHSAVASIADDVGNALGGVALLICAGSLILRWRRASDETTRDQLKWLLAAAALWPVVILVLVLSPTSFSDSHWGELLFSIPIDAMLIAVVVAVLRYRLYEIDRLVSRTLSYFVLTGVLVSSYLGCVWLTTQALPLSSSVSVAASTLAAAAAFHPLRRRIQAVVDHRFNRAKYDAARAVEGFAARLRDDVDTEDVRRDLLAAAAHSMQPATVSLWVAG